MVQLWACAWWTPKVAVALEESHSLKGSLAFRVENWKHFLGAADFKGGGLLEAFGRLRSVGAALPWLWLRIAVLPTSYWFALPEASVRLRILACAPGERVNLGQ